MDLFTTQFHAVKTLSKMWGMVLQVDRVAWQDKVRSYRRGKREKICPRF